MTIPKTFDESFAHASELATRFKANEPYEREVKIEKRVMVGDRGKRADYAFFTDLFWPPCLV